MRLEGHLLGKWIPVALSIDTFEGRVGLILNEALGCTYDDLKFHVRLPMDVITIKCINVIFRGSIVMLYWV